MKRFLILIISIILALSLASCASNGDSGTAGNNTNQTASQVGNNSDPTSPEAAFAQFGLNVNDVKPGLGIPSDVTIKYGNQVDKSVYSRRAAWKEKLDTEVERDAGMAYNQKMFGLCKAASADGKIYRNKTNSEGDPPEITAIEDLIDKDALINVMTWSYKVDGIWVDVYMDWSMLGDEIGISINGSATY